MSAFVISKRLDGNYKFTFANRKGKTVFTSISCKQKADCKLIIAALQADLSNFSFSRKQTPSGKHFFRIAKGGLVLATSRKFTTPLLLQKGLDQILKYVPDAETLDFSEDTAEDIFEDTETVMGGIAGE